MFVGLSNELSFSNFTLKGHVTRQRINIGTTLPEDIGNASDEKSTLNIIKSISIIFNIIFKLLKINWLKIRTTYRNAGMYIACKKHSNFKYKMFDP
jgi:hypothetical protein